MTRETGPKARPDAENAAEHTTDVDAFICPVCSAPMPEGLISDQAYRLGRHLEGHDETLVTLLYLGLDASRARLEPRPVPRPRGMQGAAR